MTGSPTLLSALRLRTVGGAQAAGAVSVLYGSASGLTATGGRLFTQVGGAVESGDWFGFALAAGDFNNDGFADLAAGAAGRRSGALRGRVRSVCCLARLVG